MSLNLKKIWALGALLALSGCSTIHFDNGPETGGESYSSRYSHWHHVGILSLVEFSDAEDMSRLCEGKNWSSVKVEQGPLQVLVTLLIGGFYSPWDVQYGCEASEATPMRHKRKNST